MLNLKVQINAILYTYLHFQLSIIIIIVIIVVSWDGEEDSEKCENSPEKEKLQTINEIMPLNNRGETEVIIHGQPYRGKDKKVQNLPDRGRKPPEEKETVVEKSPSGDSANYAIIDDIKFADEDEDENRIENSVV